MCESFVQALMERIKEGTMIPKVQVERAVAPILSLFLEDALTEVFKIDPDLSGRLITVCPEFPLKKAGNGQSTNVDWLMHNSSKKQIIFLELKTSDTSVDAEQSEIYRDKQAAVRRQGASFLIDDLRQLRDASGERGKYHNVLENSVEKLRDAFDVCRDAVIVYLAPRSARLKGVHADRVLSFSMLPETLSGPFGAEWNVVRPYLCEIDESCRRTRNRTFNTMTNVDLANFADCVDFQSILRICRQSGDGVVVGYSGGVNALASSDIPSLETRRYKWDHATGGSGSKNPSNWVGGTDFLRLVNGLNMRSAEVPSAPIPRTSNWEGTLSFLPMVDLCVQRGDAVMIGFTGGKEAFQRKRLVDLKNRPAYKWDFAENTTKKKRADWILGSEIVEMLVHHHGYHRHQQVT